MKPNEFLRTGVKRVGGAVVGRRRWCTITEDEDFFYLTPSSTSSTVASPSLPSKVASFKLSWSENTSVFALNWLCIYCIYSQ
jgi:hypothetical protein